MITAETIKAARKRAGLTQAELAALIDARQSVISLIETGLRPAERLRGPAYVKLCAFVAEHPEAA